MTKWYSTVLFCHPAVFGNPSGSWLCLFLDLKVEYWGQLIGRKWNYPFLPYFCPFWIYISCSSVLCICIYNDCIFLVNKCFTIITCLFKGMGIQFSWQSPCEACVNPWIWFLAPQKLMWCYMHIILALERPGQCSKPAWTMWNHALHPTFHLLPRVSLRSTLCIGTAFFF